MGKSVELVTPVTYALPELSTAMPVAKSSVKPAATQISGVNQSRSRGVELGHESVVVAAAVSWLQGIQASESRLSEVEPVT